jgi:anti-sigma regulatory factor (Ser/Thr protein kinase)
MNLANSTILLVDQHPSGIDGLDLMRKAVFTYKTPDAARELAALLAGHCPEPRRVVVGLAELLLNAVEHGNLRISHEEKTRLRTLDRWEEEVTARLAHPTYADRAVWVEFTREPSRIRVRIRDQGNGFDWRSHLERDPAQVTGLHGRGIAIARLVSFDTIEFLGKGNEVEVTVDIQARI